jgi:hypothetical protein
MVAFHYFRVAKDSRDLINNRVRHNKLNPPLPCKIVGLDRIRVWFEQGAYKMIGVDNDPDHFFVLLLPFDMP